jgi:peptidoglycan/xylan/chitin deacetylase (PgdA/CDA1 family)
MPKLALRAMLALCLGLHLVVHASTAAATGAGAPEAAFPWPRGERAAVSLAYDDALDSQLQNALPALDRAGLKATFYLSLASPNVARQMAAWRRAAMNGHELGNHTLFHACSRSAPDRAWVTPDNDLDTVSAAQLVAQIRVGNTLLQALDGRQERSFAAPCGDALARGEPYLPLLREDFVAMKTRFGGVVADMAALDVHAVPVLVPAGASGAQLIALVQRAARAGTMINLTFHGVGGDFLSVSSQAHDELLQHLAENRHLYWTDSFINIMKHVKAVRARAQPR